MPVSRPEVRPPPRKTPKQRRSRETVRAIVEAAARVLEKHGHGGFSTNAVAAQAGVSVGSLYQYFPSKDALIGALVSRETSMLVEDVTIAAEKTDGMEALYALIAACIAHQFRRPQLARLLDFEEARLPLDADTQRVGEQIQQLAVAILRKPGLPVQSDLHVAAGDVVAIIKGMVDMAGQRGERQQQTLASRVRHAVFGYLLGEQA